MDSSGRCWIIVLATIILLTLTAVSSIRIWGVERFRTLRPALCHQLEGAQNAAPRRIIRSKAGGDVRGSGILPGSSGAPLTGTTTCYRFSPAECHFIKGQAKPFRYPVCANHEGHLNGGGHDCSFDPRTEFPECLSANTGRYSQTKGPSGECSSPQFLVEASVSAAKLPSCDRKDVCCSGEGMSGYWEQSTWPGHDVDFRESSDMKCRYHPYTRKQVLQCMGDTKLVMWGDSMVRQLFNRLPALFRGQLRSLDIQGWSIMRYDACESVDSITHAPDHMPHIYEKFQEELIHIIESDHPVLRLDGTYQAQVQNTTGNVNKPSLFSQKACGGPPASFWFMPAVEYLAAELTMMAYLKTHPDLSKVVYLAHIGIWDKNTMEPPQEYLDVLDAALAAGLKQLIVLTVPTQNVKADLWSTEHADHLRVVYRTRNEGMRQWAHAHPSGRVSLLDYDALTRADNSPRGLISNFSDPHYACKVIPDWEGAHDKDGNTIPVSERLATHDGWLDTAGWAMETIVPNQARDCKDDMNRTLLQVLLNMMCNKR